MKEKLAINNILEQELDWFSQVLNARIEAHFTQAEMPQMPVPDLSGDEGQYAELVRKYDLQGQERLLLMLAIVPQIKPQVLDPLQIQNVELGIPFIEFGGYHGKYHRGFLPTGTTALFLLAGNHVADRKRAMSMLSEDHPLLLNDIIRLERIEGHEPRFSSPLTLSPRYQDVLIQGRNYSPESYALFPAKKIQTALEWSDLVISDQIMEEIELIKNWVDQGEKLLRDKTLGRKIKPGYRALFYGPPGTGKTMTACLLGKSTGLEVYRIDLSSLVSKYIGETEKNLARIFDLAEKNRWILFFDEADAIFGKRTHTNSANDRFANQEVAYLLQRIEDFPGVVILASNLRSNIDAAFSRRFQSIIYFGMPELAQRKQIWERTFSGTDLSEGLDLNHFASKYELSGGAVINVFRRSLLRAMTRDRPVIHERDILEGIKKEMAKEGKTL